MKHFVINLKHRPERLCFWLGYQFSKGLDPQGVQIVNAIDKDDFSTIGDMAEYAIDRDLDYWKLKIHDTGKSNGYSALRLTHDLLLRYIAENVTGRELCTIWIDDIFLTVSIEEYNWYLNRVSKLNCAIIAMHKYEFRYFGGSSAESKNIAIFNERDAYLHESELVYTRCVGSGFNMCFVVTPRGASELIEFTKGDPTSSLLYLLYRDRDLTDNFIYTAVPALVKCFPFFGSDIEDDVAPLDIDNKRICF